MIQVSTLITMIGSILIFTLFTSHFLKQPLSKGQKIASVLFEVYLMFLIYYTLTPFSMNILSFHRSLQLIPFQETFSYYHIHGMQDTFVEVGKIILSFIPFGLLFPVLFTKQQTYHQVVLQGFVASLLLKATQYIYGIEVFDIDTLIFNFIGVSLGYFLFQLFNKGKGNLKTKKVHLKWNLFASIFLALCLNLFLGLSMAMSYYANTSSLNGIHKKIQKASNTLLQEESQDNFQYEVIQTSEKGLFVDVYQSLPLNRYYRLETSGKLIRPNTFGVLCDEKKLSTTSFPTCIFGSLEQDHESVQLSYEQEDLSVSLKDGSFISLFSKQDCDTACIVKNLEAYRVGESGSYDAILNGMQDAGASKEISPLPLTTEMITGIYPLGKNYNILENGQDDLRFVPASLTKMFTIYYSMSVLDPMDVVNIEQSVLKHTKEGSSVAWLQPGKMYVKDLVAAMMVPSGNDASLVMAIACDEKVHGKSTSFEESMNRFLKDMNAYLQEKQFFDTSITSPSGYADDCYTSMEDVNRVAYLLLQKDWFKKMIGTPEFEVTSLNNDHYTWRNTNRCLHPKDKFYNKHIKGVKTGSLSSYYNIVALYEKDGQYYLFDVLRAPTDEQRYQALQSLIEEVE